MMDGGRLARRFPPEFDATLADGSTAQTLRAILGHDLIIILDELGYLKMDATGRLVPPKPSPSPEEALAAPSNGELAAVARRLKQAGAPLSPLTQWGPEVPESAARTTASTNGFVTHDEDGQAVAVVSGEGA